MVLIAGFGAYVLARAPRKPRPHSARPGRPGAAKKLLCPAVPPLPADSTRWFAEEVSPHEGALRGWLRVRFPSLADRDDLVQESYLRIMRAHETGPIASPKAFLFATARNLALNHLRHRRYEPNELGDFDVSGVLDECADVPESVARAQETQHLNEAIQSLPERCREVFALRRLHGLSTKETAARLGIAEKTVEAQCIIALRKCVEFFRQIESSKSVRSVPVLRPVAHLALGGLQSPHA
jgi:RNA polymerase sigma-70 factor (ECF subfamily)